MSGLRNEAEQLLASLKSVHQAEIKAVSDIAATVSFVEVCGYDIVIRTEQWLPVPDCLLNICNAHCLLLYGLLQLGLSAPADEEGVSAADTIKKLEAAVSADPADLEARHNLALKLFQLERFEEAINQELEVGPKDVGLRHWRNDIDISKKTNAFLSCHPTRCSRLSSATKRGTLVRPISYCSRSSRR